MHKDTYKYSLNNIISPLPVAERKAIRAQLCKELGISMHTLYVYANLREDDTRSLTTDQAQIIAQTLGITISELISQSPKVEAPCAE